MNKIITLATALVLTVASYANPTDAISSHVKASFKKDFASGQILSTEVKANFTQVTFTQNEVVLHAFYNKSGDLLAVTKNIKSDALPVSLLMSLKGSYGKCWITELFELTADGDSCYYISLENADKKITLRSNGESWEEYSTVRK